MFHTSKAATTVSDIAASAVVLSCKIAVGVSIGEDSLIYNSNFSGGLLIGSQSIVVGINVPEDSDRMIDSSVKFMLPDRHCLWEVPLVGCTERVIVFCGIHDNPKEVPLVGAGGGGFALLLAKDATRAKEFRSNNREKSSI